jgi:hypothetical protein
MWLVQKAYHYDGETSWDDEYVCDTPEANYLKWLDDYNTTMARLKKKNAVLVAAGFAPEPTPRKPYEFGYSDDSENWRVWWTE